MLRISAGSGRITDNPTEYIAKKPAMYGKDDIFMLRTQMCCITLMNLR